PRRRFPGRAAALPFSVPLGSNAPGIYRVDWTAVSADDGHTLSGRLSFGVGVKPGPASSGGQPSVDGLLLVVPRLIEYVALLLAIGLLVVRALARRAPSLDWVRPRMAWILG